MEVSDYSCRNSGQIHFQQHQIPAFGDWDKAKDLPITQYFESARQAGLIRYSSSSGESGPCLPPSDADRKKPPPSAAARKGRVREKRYPHVGLKEHHQIQIQIPIKKQQQQGRVFDVTETGERENSSRTTCRSRVLRLDLMLLLDPLNLLMKISTKFHHTFSILPNGTK